MRNDASARSALLNEPLELVAAVLGKEAKLLGPLHPFGHHRGLRLCAMAMMAAVSRVVGVLRDVSHPKLRSILMRSNETV
jgi:hypothetical protein